MNKGEGEIAPVEEGRYHVIPGNAESGSFGPNQAYRQVDDGYVVDISDCQVAGSAATPGAPIGGGPGSMRVVRFSCVATARARLVLQDDLVTDMAGLDALDTTASRTRNWTVQGQRYRQLAFMRSHDARATILTPEMLVAVE